MITVEGKTMPLNIHQRKELYSLLKVGDIADRNLRRQLAKKTPSHDLLPSRFLLLLIVLSGCALFVSYTLLRRPFWWI